MKLAGVCLIAQDVPALAAFYEALLGQAGYWEGTEHVDFPGAGFSIFSVSGMEEMAPGSTAGTGTGRAVLSLDVPDADEQARRLPGLGGQVLLPPTTHPWGLRSTWVKDPAGNLLSLRSPAK